MIGETFHNPPARNPLASSFDSFGVIAMAGFSLIDEPWLPCLTLAGRPVEVCLRDVIERSHEYRELFDQSPLVTVALYRLLLALIRRVYGIHSADQWRRLRTAGRFDSAAAAGYFDRFSDRFDLFSPSRPFMQSQLPPETQRHPCSLLVREAASGNNPTLFDHSRDASPRPLSPGEAARCLVAAHASALGGGVSSPFNFCDATLARDSTALICGTTLFETLLLNSPPVPAEPDDAPVWEWDGEIVPERGGTHAPGVMALYTWPARRIRLVTDDDGRSVAACQVLQGLIPDPDRRDPMKAFRGSQSGSQIALRLAPGRAVWRDLPIWLGLAPDAICPAAVTWLRHSSAACAVAGQTAAPLQLAIFGLATAPGRASVVFWRHERYPLPSFCLDDSEAIHECCGALARAEAASELLTAALAFLGRLLNAPSDAVLGLQDVAGLTCWAELDRTVRGFLLTAATDPTAAVAEWDACVTKAVTEAFTCALARCGRVPGRARSAVAAGRFFTQQLAAIMGRQARPSGEKG